MVTCYMAVCYATVEYWVCVGYRVDRRGVSRRRVYAETAPTGMAGITSIAH